MTLTPARAAPAAVVPLSGSRMTADELAGYLRERLEDRLLDARIEHGLLTATVAPEAWHTSARLCKFDPRLDCDFFEFLAGVDEREQGFGVVLHVYSIRHGHHIQLRALVPGGREAPALPSVADVYRGADWAEREAYDMFGIDFEGHPGLEPRILTIENFEGWPLRKDFLLTTREIKPWPGLKEPKDEEEEVAEADGAEAVRGPSAEDKAAAAKAKAERAKRKAAEMRAKKARERAEERGAEETAPTADDVVPKGADAREVAEQSDAGGVVYESARESGGLTTGGAPAERAGTPGTEAEGRHTGAVEQSGDRPAAETPGMTSPTQHQEPAREVSETPAPGPESDVADETEPGSSAPDGPGTDQNGTDEDEEGQAR